MHLNPKIAAHLSALNNPALPSIDLSLDRMHALLAALGNPERKLPPVIHLAGTNGKGSTLAFLRAIYEAAGYRVHAYTSPHLVSFNERIMVGGSPIGDEALLALLSRVAEVAAKFPVTFFEATTALAFMAFAEQPADMVLLETGLGGRLDATNVVAQPLATVITPIDYDHMEFLGDTRAKIALEKAGIMKHSVPCVVGAQPPEVQAVFEEVAGKLHAPLTLHGRDWHYAAHADHIAVSHTGHDWHMPQPALMGAHQHHNAALASVVAKSIAVLPVMDEALNNGIANAHWPARLQKLISGPLVEAWGARGEVILDGGHNPSAAHALAAWLNENPTPTTLLCGMMKRKDAHGFLLPLAPHITRMIAVPIAENDSFAPEELAEIGHGCGIAQVHAYHSPEEAAKQWDDANGRLLIAGSLFLAGQVLKTHG
jgi:dihydrofolate synthase/folylpolyglutamate synthase